MKIKVAFVLSDLKMDEIMKHRSLIPLDVHL